MSSDHLHWWEYYGHQALTDNAVIEAAFNVWWGTKDFGETNWGGERDAAHAQFIEGWTKFISDANTLRTENERLQGVLTERNRLANRLKDGLMQYAPELVEAIALEFVWGPNAGDGINADNYTLPIVKTDNVADLKKAIVSKRREIEALEDRLFTLIDP